MASYGLNSMGGFFQPAMADLGDYEQDHQMDEDGFADALEHQARLDTDMDGLRPDLPTNHSAYNDIYDLSTSSHTLIANEQADVSHNHDRAHKTKQGYTRFPAHAEHYNPLNEPAKNIKVNKSSATEKHAAAYRDILKKSSEASQIQHTPGCSGARGASTPPPTPPPQSSSTEPIIEVKTEIKHEPRLESKVLTGPDDLRDVAKPFMREKRWHEKVAHLHPQVPLASHRYWIGVLNVGLAPRTACKETHFTWMKGNRLTTVETVRKVYAATTMQEGAFMMGGERPEDQDRMEELDLFNDKVVLFKVAEEGTPASVGRLITEGLVTKEIEVIELDD